MKMRTSGMTFDVSWSLSRNAHQNLAERETMTRTVISHILKYFEFPAIFDGSWRGCRSNRTTLLGEDESALVEFGFTTTGAWANVETIDATARDLRRASDAPVSHLLKGSFGISTAALKGAH